MYEILDGGFEQEKKKNWFSPTWIFQFFLSVEIPIFLFLIFFRLDLLYGKDDGLISLINTSESYENGWTFIILAMMILINIASLKNNPKPIYWSLNEACFLSYFNWIYSEPELASSLFVGLFFIYLFNFTSKRYNVTSLHEKLKYSFLIILFVFLLDFLRNNINIINP